MLFSVIVGILTFIGFTGAVGMVLNKSAAIVAGAMVGVVALAFVLTSVGIGFAGAMWAAFGVVSLTIGVMALCDVA